MRNATLLWVILAFLLVIGLGILLIVAYLYQIPAPIEITTRQEFLDALNNTTSMV